MSESAWTEEQVSALLDTLSRQAETINALRAGLDGAQAELYHLYIIQCLNIGAILAFAAIFAFLWRMR